VTGFADIVTTMVAYLAGMLAPVSVATRVPETRPLEFVQVRRVGGPALPPVRETVRLDVFCWAETEARAYQLGTYVREAMWALSSQMLAGVPVYEVGEFMGPTMTADDQTRTPQLWATYELIVRADSAIHRM
jgi:hypothetical protein